MFPPIEPYETGLLDVGDDNHVHWEVSGNPEGKPALIVHGGPGSGSSPGARRLFDPARYRIVQVDQRGCGRSTPNAADPATDMRHNTTGHLIADMERLRERLGIDRWLLYGGSWGSTLILAYAERHPDRVSEIVLAAVTMTRRSDTDWLYRGVGRFFPEEWERFLAGANAHEADARGDEANARDQKAGARADETDAHGHEAVARADEPRNDAAVPDHDATAPGGGIVGAYARLMEHPDPAVREQATVDWCAWEDAVLSSEIKGKSRPYGDRPPAARRAFVRICAHFFSHGVWLDEGVLLREADRLAGIPGVLIHGRLDLGGPLRTAWELHRAWPGSELIVIEEGGHLATAATREHVLHALARFSGEDARLY